VGRAGAGRSPWPRLAVQSTKLGQVCSASALRFSSLLCVRSYPVGHSHLTIRRPAKAFVTIALIGAAITWAPTSARAWPLAHIAGAAWATPGPGTMYVNPDQVAASGTTSLTFTYKSDPAGVGLKGGTFTLTVPDGWTSPTSSPGGAGYLWTSALCGSRECAANISNMTVTFSPVTLAPGGSFTITYTAATAPNSVAAFDFAATETPLGKPSVDFPTTDLPATTVTTCANGVGTMTVMPQSVSVSRAQNYVFTYSAAACGIMQGGAISMDVPAGWTPPSTTQGSPGYAAVSLGDVTASGQKITITNVLLAPGQKLRLSYDDAVATSPGYAIFNAAEQSGDNALPAALTSSPQVTVLAATSSSSSVPSTSPDSGGNASPAGSGTMTVFPQTVTASRPITLTFTYTAPPSGLPQSGTIALTIPPQWTPPSSIRGRPGYTNASAGHISVVGRKITVTDVAMPSGRTLTITYHDATAPRAQGRAEFSAQERASSAVAFVLVAPSPVIYVAAGATVVPPWLVPLLGVALLAACAAVALLSIRNRRIRSSRSFAQVTELVVNPRPHPPKVAVPNTTGKEPTLALLVEPHPGAITRTLTR